MPFVYAYPACLAPPPPPPPPPPKPVVVKVVYPVVYPAHIEIPYRQARAVNNQNNTTTGNNQINEFNSQTNSL